MVIEQNTNIINPENVEIKAPKAGWKWEQRWKIIHKHTDIQSITVQS